MLVRKGKKYNKAIKEAYSMLVVFRKIIEDNPAINTYSPEKIEET